VYLRVVQPDSDHFNPVSTCTSGRPIARKTRGGNLGRFPPLNSYFDHTGKPVDAALSVTDRVNKFVTGRLAVLVNEPQRHEERG